MSSLRTFCIKYGKPLVLGLGFCTFGVIAQEQTLPISAAELMHKTTGQFQWNSEQVGSTVLWIVLITTILGLCMTVVRQHHYTQRLRNNQKLLESIFDQSTHYIGIFDLEGRLISCNGKLQHLLYRHGESLLRPIWQHKGWEDSAVEHIQNYFAESLPQTRLFNAEIWHPDYGAIVLECQFKPMPTREESQILLEAQDITWRKITEDKLFQREAGLRHYYDQQPVMMLTLDERNHIQQINQFAEQLLGYPADAMLGHHIRDFYQDDEALTPRQMLLLPSRNASSVWRREVCYRHHSGEAVWVRENIRPLVETGTLLIVGEDISETRQLADQLAYQARYDLLTHTLNRNQFELELAKALKETESQLRTHAMLYLDLDQLKVLNDTAGHDAGDGAIQFCASMLEEVLPFKATLARMGGDEFSVLLRDCTERDAELVAQNIIHALSEVPFVWEHIRFNLTCSIGIRMIDHTATSPQMVHAQADTACHAAKEEGRNRFNLYRQDDADLRRRQLEMECVNLVHDALANERIELFAQRIVPLNQPDLQLHFEVLVRIKNAAGEYVSPGIFVPASERYNLAHRLDRQIVEQTLSWFEVRPEVVDKLGRVSINLSGNSIGNPDFVAFLLDRLGNSHIPCSKVCFEITETAAMRNLNQAIAVLSQLKGLGCVLALDDFGSGLSSFGYLQKLPVDIVKIDGIFVCDMDQNEMDRLMVRSIHELTKQMGKTTVAEFVENEQILQALQLIGVDYAQGYLFSRPQPIADLVAELLKEKA
nr:bifunctional diguanylate cyclase/phosphodiesterase [Vibrio mimicus]